MGLGKTIQSIATIVANRPVIRAGQKTPRGTLIVAPVALLSQASTDSLTGYIDLRLSSVFLPSTFLNIIVGGRNH